MILLGKSFDTSCPLGPWLTTKDEVGDPQNLKMQLRLNGELRQDANTSDMIYGVRDLVSWWSCGTITSRAVGQHRRHCSSGGILLLGVASTAAWIASRASREGLIWSNPQTYAQQGSGTPTRGVALLQPLCSEEPTRSL